MVGIVGNRIDDLESVNEAGEERIPLEKMEEVQNLRRTRKRDGGEEERELRGEHKREGVP